ncbi:MAG: hypothetical protein MUC48_23770 [Leptolyngbya sp. Prado105]|nr:hypothetical protein [Leptolyngbya sp. Prado105]
MKAGKQITVTVQYNNRNAPEHPAWSVSYDLNRVPGDCDRYAAQSLVGT